MGGKTNPKAKVRRRKNRGRPRIKINLEDFAKLCYMQATNAELAGFFYCSTRCMDNYVAKEPYKTIRAKAEAEGKISVRRGLYRGVQNENSRVLVHMSKVVLKNVEKNISEVSGLDGKPIETRNVHIYLPDNGRKDRN